jgi:cell division protein FtsB
MDIKNKTIEGKKKHLLAKEIVLIILCLLFFVIYYSYRSREDGVNRLLNLLEDSKKANTAVLERFRDKRIILNELKTDQGVERAAREKLKLVKKGETLYIPRKAED